MKYTTLTPPDMRNINCTAVLELIRRDGPITRSYISEKLQLSLPSVMRIVEDLVDENLLEYKEEDDKNNGNKRNQLVELNAKGNITIGLDLGGGRIYGAVIDLGGDILFDRMILNHNQTGEEIYALILPLINELLGFAKQTGRIIRGMGIGVPGITKHIEGIVQWAPSLNWRNYPLKHKLQSDFDLPVTIERDVNLSALGESWFGFGRNYADLAFLRVGTGVGMGLVLGGTLFRGAHEAAGEIRYLVPGREDLGKEYVGFTSLEHFVAGVGLSKQAKQVMEGKMPPDELEHINGEYVFNALRGGEAWAKPIVDILCDYLAMAVIAAQAMFDPSVIVLGGGVSKAADLFIDCVKERIKGRLPAEPNLQVSEIGYKSSVLGAMINILHNTSNYFTVKKLS